MRIMRLSFLLLLWPTVLWAETVELGEAIRAAVAERPLVQAARQQATASSAAVGEARSRYLPRLTLAETLNRTNEPGGSLFIALNQARNVMLDPRYDLIDPPPQSDFETRLTLEQPLFDPEIYYGHRMAVAEADAARADARWGADQAGFAAFRAYLEVQQAAAAQQWAESSLLESAEIVRLTEERQSAGLSLKADLLRARVYRSETERRALTSRNDLLLAQRRLALAIGRNGGSVEIAAPLVAADFPLPAEAVAAERADLAALAAREAATELQLKQSRGAWLPRAGIGAYYALHDPTTPFGNEADAWGLRAGLTWELFDGLRRSHGTARAAAQRDAAKASQTEAQRQSQYAVEEARLRAEEAQLQAELASQAAIEAEESFRLTQQRYAAGLADLSTLLATGSALDRARYDSVAAEAGLILARGNVRLQSGIFLQDYVSEKEILP